MLVFTVIVGDFSKSDKYAIKKENRERNPSPGNSYCTHAMLDVFDYFPSEHRSFAAGFVYSVGAVVSAGTVAVSVGAGVSSEGCSRRKVLKAMDCSSVMTHQGSSPRRM